MGRANPAKRFINIIFDEQEEKFIKAAVDVNFLEFVEKGKVYTGAKEVYKKLKPLSSYRKPDLDWNAKAIFRKWNAKTDYYKEKILEEIDRSTVCKVSIK